MLARLELAIYGLYCALLGYASAALLAESGEHAGLGVVTIALCGALVIVQAEIALVAGRLERD